MKESIKENILIGCLVYLTVALPICLIVWLMSGRGLTDYDEEYRNLKSQVAKLQYYKDKHVHPESNKAFTGTPVINQYEFDKKFMIQSEFVLKYQGAESVISNRGGK